MRAIPRASASAHASKKKSWKTKLPALQQRAWELRHSKVGDLSNDEFEELAKGTDAVGEYGMQVFRSICNDVDSFHALCMEFLKLEEDNNFIPEGLCVCVHARVFDCMCECVCFLFVIIYWDE